MGRPTRTVAELGAEGGRIDVHHHMGGVAPFLGERLALGHLNHRFVNPERTAKPVGAQPGSRAR